MKKIAFFFATAVLALASGCTRADPTFQAIAAQMGVTDEQLDEIFRKLED